VARDSGSKTTIVQRETILSFNIPHEKKQTTKRDKHEKKQLLLKKMGPKHHLGPLYRVIA
jgi:hypothetical protein